MTTPTPNNMKIGEKEIDLEKVFKAMCDVGLIQFDSTQPDFVFSVWGFDGWNHDPNIIEAIHAAMPQHHRRKK